METAEVCNDCPGSTKINCSAETGSKLLLSSSNRGAARRANVASGVDDVAGAGEWGRIGWGG